MKAYTNSFLFTGRRFMEGMAVLVENGFVLDLASSNEIPSQAEVIDLEGLCLAPAFIDLQLYGGNGKLFSNDLTTAAIQATYEYCLSGGCTQFMITLATNTIGVFEKGIEAVKLYWQQGGKGLLGLHLEGPYINAAKKGAHMEHCIKTPTHAEVKSLLEKGKDVIRIMTLAPEKCDPSIIELLRENGVVVSAGHTNASYSEAISAFDNGIPAATHLYNAMSPLQHREPGMVGAIFNHRSACSSIVVDGVHVDYAAVKIAKAVMKERLFLITDAVTETPDGEYRHVFKGDRFTLPNGTLSGSSLTMMKAVKNCVDHADILLAEALRMASLYPARLIKKDNQLGRIVKGYKAEFVVFDKQLGFVTTVI